MTCGGASSAQVCYATPVVKTVELEEVPMQIVGALDVHRRQITFKTLELASGESARGRISPAAREPLRQWLERFAGQQGEFVLEGTTGWRFVVEEIERAGHVARLADPAETAARRGRKRRAKTDDADCELQLRLLLAGELPEAWIPPAGGVDPARADPRVAHPRAVAQDVDRSAHGLAAAAAGAALPPRRAARLEAAHRCRTRCARPRRVVSRRPRGRRALPADARPARPRAGADRPRATDLRAPAARLPRLDRAALRRRRRDRDGDPRRTGRCAPLPQLRRRRPSLRPRRHRLAVRPKVRRRPPLTPGPLASPLGVV